MCAYNSSTIAYNYYYLGFTSSKAMILNNHLNNLSQIIKHHILFKYTL